MKSASKSCSACGEEYETGVLFCPKDGTPLASSRLLSSPGTDVDSYVGMELPGQIKIVSLLGVGSMGRVYRAFQSGIERDVAVKVLHRELSSNSELVNRFHREAKIASRLVHPNVVQVLMTGTLPFCADPHVGGELYLVMEHLDGISLLSALAAAGTDGEGEALSLSRALHIALQICDAVGEAHQQGIVHRDIKPENVMLVRRGEDYDYVKVLDFGIARLDWADRSMTTKAGLIFGTAKYISPEGAEGQAVGPTADVYAIATILYQCLAGRAPFEGDSPVALLVQHTHAPPVELLSIGRASYVPEPIAKVIMQNLAKKPSDRAENARELGRDLMSAARASGMSPETLAGQSGLVSTGKGVLQLPSKQRTKALEMTPEVAAEIDMARGSKPRVAKASNEGTTTPGAPLDDAGRGDSSGPGETEAGLAAPAPRASSSPTLLEDEPPPSGPRSRRSYPPRARRSYPSRSSGQAAHATDAGDASPRRARQSSRADRSARESDSIKRWVGILALVCVAGIAGLWGGRRLMQKGEHQADSVEATVEAARDAMRRHAWLGPAPRNLKVVMADASERWPDDPRIEELHEEAAQRVLAAALGRRYAGDRDEALSLAQLALALDPGLTTAQHFVVELEKEPAPDVAPVDSSEQPPASAPLAAKPGLGSSPSGPGASSSSPAGSGSAAVQPAPSVSVPSEPAFPSASASAPSPEASGVGPPLLPPPPPALPADHQPAPAGSGPGPWL